MLYAAARKKRWEEKIKSSKNFPVKENVRCGRKELFMEKSVRKPGDFLVIQMENHLPALRRTRRRFACSTIRVTGPRGNPCALFLHSFVIKIVSGFHADHRWTAATEKVFEKCFDLAHLLMY
jgi:hypothetical protein